MNANWIIVGAGVAWAVVLLARSRLRRGQRVDLGTVSPHWIAEQRLGGGDQRS